MGNQWLRLWHDLPNDPKWRTISKASKQRIGDVISVYLHLLVCGSNATERGRTQSFNSEDVANALDLEPPQVEAILHAMQGRVLDGDLLRGWAARQPIREDSSAQRAKAWRDSKRTERNRTQPNATERERTQDKDKDKDKDKDNILDTTLVGEGLPEEIFTRTLPPPAPAPEEKKTPKPKKIKSHIVTEEFWGKIRANPVYARVNLEKESAKMDLWLAKAQNSSRRKTEGFVLNWLNRALEDCGAPHPDPSPENPTPGGWWNGLEILKPEEIKG